LLRNWLGLLLLAAACRGVGAERLERFEFEHPQMGTQFRIALYSGDAQRANAAAAAAFVVLDRLNASLSDYEPDSELSRLSRASESAAPTDWIAVSDDLAFVLERAAQIAKASGGAFDISCGKAARLWRRAIRERELPAAEALAAALAATDWRAVELSADGSSARLLRRGMRLDLGGIAKGYALDRMLQTLREHGIDSALVDGGGDVAALAPPPGARGWLVRVRALDALGAASDPLIELAHAAIATSGDLFQSVELDGVRYSHLVDPRSGLGLSARGAASVIAADATSADALATATCVLGEQGAQELWASFPGFEFRWISAEPDDRHSVESPGFSAWIAR
jgi:thiamine biosynthesis lipoprotein